MKTVEIRGVIIDNDLKEIADWLGMEATSPRDVKSIIDTLDRANKEDLEVVINSGGGYVTAGQEIYSLLHELDNVTVYVNSLAASAASLIAMGATMVVISPAAQLMIHNVGATALMSGDYHEYDKAARSLKDTNDAIATAYAYKTGMTKDKILNLMDKETWLSAERAVELGFADSIGVRGKTEDLAMAASVYSLLTPELIAKAKAGIEADKKRNEKHIAVADRMKKLCIWR